MTEAELPGLTAQVLGTSFALAIAFGAIAQHTRFCTMGAVADIVTMGDWSRMRAWLLAIAVAIVGFNTMVAFGWVQAKDTLYATPTVLWLSNLVGGLLFGFGMVLASGCGSKTLVRIGAGNLKSLVVFFVLGLAAYATLRGVTAVARVATLDTVSFTLKTGQDLPSLLAGTAGQSLQWWAHVSSIVIGVLLLAFVLARPGGRTAEVWLGGVGIGLVVVGVWWVSGRLGHLLEHPQTLEETFLATNSRRMESLSFVAPLAYTLDWLILFSDKSKTLTIGIVSVFGVIAGSALAALATRSFRWEGFRGAEDTANHIVGGALMGVGGVLALGCTVGQGITGVSTLALGSFITLAALIGGALLALRWQAWRMDRLA
jgi:uncharacterized protein